MLKSTIIIILLIILLMLLFNKEQFTGFRSYGNEVVDYDLYPYNFFYYNSKKDNKNVLFPLLPRILY